MPSPIILFGYFPTNGVGIIAGCRISVCVQRRPEPRTSRQVFASSLIQISMAARTSDLTVAYPAIGVYSQPKTGRPFTFLAQGPRRIVIRIGPVSGIATGLRIRPLRRWWRWRWRRRRCHRWRWWRCRWNRPHWWPRSNDRRHNRRRRYHWRRFNRLFRRRGRFIRFFRRLLLLNVDHIQLRCNFLDGSIG